MLYRIYIREAHAHAWGGGGSASTIMLDSLYSTLDTRGLVPAIICISQDE